MRKLTVGLSVVAISVCMVCSVSAKTVYSSWVTKPDVTKAADKSSAK